MGRYSVRRLLQLIPVVLGTTFLIYVMTWARPGDPFAGKCGQRPCPEPYIAAQTERLDRDDPLLVQYFKYLQNLFTGNLGETFGGESISTLIAAAFPITLRLTVLAIIIQLVVGVALGIVSALRRGGVVDNGVLIFTLLIVSIPIFVFGFLTQYVFGVKLGWFPVTASPEVPTSDLILPAIVLAAVSLAFVARLTRTSLTESMRADYVRTAVASVQSCFATRCATR